MPQATADAAGTDGRFDGWKIEKFRKIEKSL
jgi:hypothetical protein